MTTERRLAKIEAALGPKELVLRWLAEAHAHDDFTPYARATYAIGPDAWPLDRLVHETIDWLEATQRGHPRKDHHERRRAALRQVLFLFYLIIRMIERTQDLLDRELLLEGFISAHLGLATIDTEDGKRSAMPTHARRLESIRTLAVARLTEWRALETARSRVEAKYLDGHPALFPATIRTWTDQLQGLKTLAVIAERLAELDGLEPSPPHDADASAARVDQLVDDLVEPARVKALDQMGEGRRAISIAMRWLAPKLG
jgi:hypothetical protein